MNNSQTFNPPPFKTIEAATQGNVTAINAIVRHYSGYIATLSMRPLWDEYGRVHMVVDPDIQRRLETKLITKVLGFKIA